MIFPVKRKPRMGYTDLIFDLYGTPVDIHTEENDPVWEKTAPAGCRHYEFEGDNWQELLPLRQTLPKTKSRTDCSVLLLFMLL